MSRISKALSLLGMRLVGASLASAMAMAAWSAEPGPTYPDHAIRFVVPYLPGGGNDAFARVVGEKLSAQVNQPVVIDNKAGAAGLIAASFVAKSSPDGYTIMVDQSSIATNQLLYKKLPINLKRELSPIMLGATLDNVVLVNASSKIHSIQELVAAAKASPGKLAYGSAGIGSSQHLAMELFCHLAGIKMLHVPYKGTAPAIVALLSDEVQVFLISVPTAQNYYKSGKLRAIATTGAQRSPVMPETPTVIESGYPSYVNYNWLGVFAPAGTPPGVLVKLNVELNKALKDAAVADVLTKQGWTLVGGPPSLLARTIDEETARYENLVRDKGLQIDQP